jgi:hypothetical protein
MIDKPMSIIKEHPLAGRTVTLKSKDPQIDGQKFWVEDYYFNLTGGTVLTDLYSPACMIYRQRVEEFNLPRDHDYVGGKIGSYSYIIHNSELGEVDESVPLKKSSYIRNSNRDVKE